MDDESPWTVQAAWVFPVDGRPLKDGCVTIRDGRVVAVERTPSRPVDENRPTAALLPGLVNVHTHLEFSDLDQPLGDPRGRFADWIGEVIAGATRPSDAASRAIALGAAELRAASVVAAGEIATSDEPGDDDAFADGPAIVRFREILGLAAERADELFSVAERHAAPNVDGDVNRLAGLSPHAPYTVRFELVERLADLARERGVPIAMHLAETGEELEALRSHSGPLVEFLRGRGFWRPDAVPRGVRILDYLELLQRAPRAIVVHGTFLDAEEIAFLAERADRMTVAYCPRTHARFFGSTYPLEEFLSAGVRVALGTDSRASNPDLSLWNEAKFVRKRFPAVLPDRLLEMATRDSAEALGLGVRFGTISPGKSAAMTTIELGDAASDDIPPWEALFGDSATPKPFVPRVGS